MPELFIDGRRIAAAPGTTVLQAARGAGIHIPSLCWQPDLPHHTSCMVCLVENEDTGSLVTACSIPAEEGQRFLASSRRAVDARRGAVELLLAEHRGDCEAPCARVCPASIDIPSVLRRLRRNRRKQALGLVHGGPGGNGGPLCLSCAAPCERACRRGRQDVAVEIRSLVLRLQTGGQSDPLEAARCLQCDCVRKASCVLRRLEGELEARRRRFDRARPLPPAEPEVSGGVSWQPSKCVKCGICVRISAREKASPGIAFSGRSFDLKVCGALGADMASALGRAAPECMARCPTGALARQP